VDEVTRNLIMTVAIGWLRHMLTIAGSSLVTYGLMKTGDTDQFVNISIGIVSGAIGLAWSYWDKAGRAKLLARLQYLQRRT
jgi:hypothetical protein